MRVSNGRVGSGRIGSKNGQIANRQANMLYKFQFFNGKYYTNIEIVECESGRIAQKWSNAGWICGYRSIRSQPTIDAKKKDIIQNWKRMISIDTCLEKKSCLVQLCKKHLASALNLLRRLPKEMGKLLPKRQEASKLIKV